MKDRFSEYVHYFSRECGGVRQWQFPCCLWPCDSSSLMGWRSVEFAGCRIWYIWIYIKLSTKQKQLLWLLFFFKRFFGFCHCSFHYFSFLRSYLYLCNHWGGSWELTEPNPSRGSNHHCEVIKFAPWLVKDGCYVKVNLRLCQLFVQVRQVCGRETWALHT